MDLRKLMRRMDTRLSIAFVCLTVVILGYLGSGAALDGANSSPFAKWLAFALWASWAMLPPCWFLVEWTLFDGDMEDDLTKLKYSQELASKFWLAGVTVISTALVGVSGGLTSFLKLVAGP